MNNENNIKQERLNIRISHNDLSFAVVDHESINKVAYEHYPIRTGIAMAANLREAFKDGELLSRGYQRALALIDSPVMLIPVQEFNEDDIESMYHHIITGMEGNAVIYQVLPNLNTVAVFCINKDLKLVIDEHFSDVRYFPIAHPVWNYLHRRSFTGVRKKLYAYFHDKRMEVFSFDKNRFKFCNSFNVDHAHDAVYYMLYTWQQLGYDVQHDEIYLAGDIPEKDWMMEALHHYVQKVYALNAETEFNHAPFTNYKDMPFDLQAIFTENR